jgi:hypothetical protein
VCAACGAALRSRHESEATSSDSLSSPCAVTTEQALQVLACAKAWIGWDLFDADRSSIRVDGQLTAAELRALLLLVMSH